MSDYRIPFTYRGEIVGWSLVDEADFDSLRRFRWTLACGYAVRADHGKPLSMHREVAGLRRGDSRVVHHRNEDHFDNRRENLQVFANASEHARHPHPKANAAQWLAGVIGASRYLHEQRLRAAERAAA